MLRVPARCSVLLAGWALVGLATRGADAAELKQQTLEAWEKYERLTEERIARELDSSQGFLLWDFMDEEQAARCRKAVSSGQVCAEKITTLDERGKKLKVPKGMIHHWMGAIRVPGAELDELLEWVRRYDEHADYFDEVLQSKLLTSDGDSSYTFFMRLERKKVVTVHYDTEHDVEYRSHGAARVSSTSEATKIAELENVGSDEEREKPQGQDSGFMWRLNSYWRYQQDEDGVLITLESISLSRGIPMILGWLVKPFVESVPRESLESTLAGIRDGFLANLAQRENRPQPLSGRWRAWLTSPGGELPFGLELERTEADDYQAWIVNGPERIQVARVELDEGELLLSFEPYDSRILATWSGDDSRLEGVWTKTSGLGSSSQLAFQARASASARFEPLNLPDGSAASNVAGRWEVDFRSEDTPAVAVLEQSQDGTVSGTFLTATGDYRYLAGSIEGDRLRLSCFDGAHAFLFDARLLQDGTLAGDFWSRDSWHEEWTARRNPEASLPDAYAMTSWTDGQDLSQIVFPDLDGRQRSLADPEFQGKARIIEVFGSWCPNCNDAASFLVELDERYRDRGLSIVGLGFELSGEFERDAEQLRRYVEHHGIEFPVLLAGVANKDEASRAFPALDRVRSFPTTIFMDAQGRVRAIHTGYSGPATGAAHEQLKARFEELIEELLGDAGTRAS